MLKSKFHVMCLIAVFGVALSGCSNIFDSPGPNEFLVEESRALAIPPDFDLQPPSETAKNHQPDEDETPGVEKAPTELEIASRKVEGATAEDPDELAKKIEEEKSKPKSGKTGFQSLLGSIF